MTKTPEQLSEMVRDYLECVLFAEISQSNPETGGDPLDQNYTVNDFSDKATAQAKADCRAFLRDAAGPLRILIDAGQLQSAGHDLLLTRNGHGAGFWDRGYPHEIGDELTKIAKAMSGVYAYVDDGEVHFQ